MPSTESRQDELAADIVIIGAGMGGGVLAHALRESGAKVLIVEAGGYLPRELENWSPEAVHLEGRYKNSDPWYTPDGTSFVPGNYHFVGGSTKLYGATLPRFREQDFGPVEHIDGTSPAWPLGYAELEPHYTTAESMFHVHGTAGEDPTEPWRSTPFPFPAVPYEATIASLVSSARSQGLHPFALPQAIDLRPGGRCLRCGTCDAFPCMVDAKGDADVCAVRPALESPDVDLLTHTFVDRLVTDPSGRTVLHAEATRRGRPITLRASRFVLAAGAVHTAALLLRSRSPGHDGGLANRSDQVGRNYMCHVTSFVLGVHPTRVNHERYHKTMGINDWYLAGADTRFPLGNVQGLGKLQGAMVKAARRLVPMSVLDAVTHRTTDLFIQTEDLPMPDNRVTLGSAGRITINREITNQSEHTELRSRTATMLRRAGNRKVLTQQLGVEATSHQCGTARMGDDASTSVVDSFGRAHDLANLWVADSSVFPSSAAVNPALTIAAFALRIAAEGELVR